MISIINFGYSLPISLIQGCMFFFISFFFCVLFLQSGFDKVFNMKSNIDFLKSHFKETIFSRFINILFLVLTFFELITGLLCFISLIGILLFGFSNQVMNFLILSIILVNMTICCLFLGQRIANDYPGAANLAIYFLVSLLSLSVLF